jgi:hypothetical protein
MQNQYRKLDIKLSVFIPENIADNEEKIEEYLNDKLCTDIDFFGYIDSGCFNVTNEKLEY